jgi:iron complex outermembrane receptor protein
MRLIRYAVAALVVVLAAPLPAQEPTGSITGQVTDALTQQPLSGVTVRIEGTRREASTRNDGGFVLTGVAPGSYRLRATRIGYAPLSQDVTVTAGAVVEARFALPPQAALIDPVVVTGYGTQRREAVTGAVSTIDPSAANVGVMSNLNGMLQGRAAGVNITQNNGEPGAGVQIRIRGATSISASNEPLYVIDGVPITNTEAEPAGIGVSGSPPLPRSPLNLLNPADIQSITILKDASATAIYGSRGANGVVLIETKKGSGGGGGGTSIQYDSYVASASPARRLGVLTGPEYRQFIQDQVALHNTDSTRGLDSSRLAFIGPGNTDWEDAVTRSAITHNHNLSFAGGSDVTRYRASLNFMDQQGVALGSGFKRVQGRLSGTHSALNNRLRLGLNISTSRNDNDYLSFENSGGFEGGVFVNMAIFNPTEPIVDSTGRYFELGTGAQSIRNPVALANQIIDLGNSTRTLANATAEMDLAPGLTASVNVGVDQAEGIRQIYFPNSSPVGAQWQGLARQTNRGNASVTFQSQVNLRKILGQVHSIDIVGAYEYTESHVEEFYAEAQGFVADDFTFNSLNSGNVIIRPFSFRNDEKWISFISRANYGYKDKYFLTGVVRYDGHSAFAEGHKWSMFPGLSGSWHISQEDFMPQGLFSDLRLRVGWGVVGNPGAPPYSSLLTLEATGGARYVFGNQVVIGFAPTRNPNPNLTFERTSQFNLGADYGLAGNRVSGSLDFYVKNTSDLLLEVDVPQPAPVTRRLENVGRVRNRGLELSVDVLAIARPGMTLRAGLVAAMEKNKVLDLGPYTLINSGSVSGEGQSGQNSQRIIPGQPLGTFWGPVFVGLDTTGRQEFACSDLGVASDSLCVGGRILGTNLRGGDSRVIGNAYPDLSLGFNSQLQVGKLDASILIRGAFGQEVFNNTALVYGTKTKVLQGRNFLSDALADGDRIGEPAIYSSRWVQSGSFVRLQNITVGYTFDLPYSSGTGRSARVYVSGDNLILLTGYSGLDPEVHAEVGLASRGIDYLSYPRPRSITAGVSVAF